MKYQDRRNYDCLSLKTFSRREGKGGQLHQPRLVERATAFGLPTMLLGGNTPKGAGLAVCEGPDALQGYLGHSSMGADQNGGAGRLLRP
jgi:hypothetical protein